MRISKSNKTSVKASIKVGDQVYIDPVSDKLPRKFGTVESIDDDNVCIRDRNDSSTTYNPNISKVHKLDIDTCGDVKASTVNTDAIKYIKAAIDVLGKSGNKDSVTKDSIANLATVMFDLKGSEKY